MGERVEIQAIRDSDLKRVLDHFGLSEKVEKGELMCESCSQVLTWDKIGALLVKGKSLVVFCNLLACMDMAATKRE